MNYCIVFLISYLSSKDLIFGTKGGGPDTPPLVRLVDCSWVVTNPGRVGNLSTMFSVVEGSSEGAAPPSLKPGGNSPETSSVSILSKSDDKEREKSGLEVVVVVEDSFSSSGALNPGGKKALTSSNLMPPKKRRKCVDLKFQSKLFKVQTWAA